METREILIFFAMCIFSYLLGGVSIARLITKKEKAGTINAQGSGNPGTMNMLRTHGLTMGLFTLLCDALKGVIPALFSLLYFSYMVDMRVAYIGIFVFGFCAVVGHIFPIYYKFKGGKGIATTFGVFMVADPISTLILFGILFVVLYFIRIGSVVSLLFITIDAILQFFKDNMEANAIALVFMCIMVLLDIYAHRQNLARLLDNRENPASLQDGLKKDIEKIKNTKSKKLEKIEKKYQEKIEKKNARVQKKIDKIQNIDKESAGETADTEESLEEKTE
ncbi:MAG: hypothetical protein E7354_01975 [Clostridiales bacterium]|nr:hypothetical protein [Clostridiales bacterium]